MSCPSLARRVASTACALLSLVTLADVAWSDVSVRAYTRKDGTYVRAHHRSDPDGNAANNWSTRGNQNPYTGEWGTKSLPYRGGNASDRSYRGPHIAPRGAAAAAADRARVRTSAIEQQPSQQGLGNQQASDGPLEAYIRPDLWSGVEGAIEITNPYVVTTPPPGAVVASVYWGEAEAAEPLDLPMLEPSPSPVIYANVVSGGSPPQLADRIDAETRQRIAKELSLRGLEVKWEEKTYDELMKLLKAL